MSLCQKRARSNGIPRRNVQMLLWQASVHVSKRGMSATCNQQVSFGQHDKPELQTLLLQASSPTSGSPPWGVS